MVSNRNPKPAQQTLMLNPAQPCRQTSSLKRSVSVPRQKQWAPRTKTGCATCRSRKVKCDERRPQCKRCVAINRECPGYALACSSVSQLVQNPLPKLCPLERKPYRDEMVMFGILRDDAVVRVAGAFMTKFWSHDVLQAIQSYPAIWHAGLAMAAAYKRSQVTGQSKPAVQARKNFYTFSLEHYNAAIGLLVKIAKRKVLSRRDRETLLIASILFLSLCALQDNVKDVMIHAQSGSKLYRQWQMYDNDAYAVPNGILSKESLTFIMTTLNCALVEPILQSTSETKSQWEKQPNNPRCSPLPFKTLKEAYMEFLPLIETFIEQGGLENYKRVFQSDKDSQSTWDAQRRGFGIWRTKFCHFQSLRKSSENELDSFLELEVYARIFEIVYSESFAAPEMAWDAYTIEFNRILDIAEQIYELRMRASTTTEGDQCRRFTLSLAPGEAFAFIGASCRDHQVRRRTIALLKKWKWRNGVWDTKVMAAMCEALMCFEEEADKLGQSWCECIPQEFICHGHRAASTQVVFVGDGEVVMCIKSVNDVGADKPGVEYVLHY